ncbi:hypothetical protein B0H14DRAFT_945020 [Mycena olivaceomarginata]|nr:hypothetical protein B0H14DRAFT_945020 [Mycena olivaceomarginata]
MKSALLLAAIALGVSAQDLTINTPTQGTVTGAAECQPLLISWSGGTPPYIITGTSLTWTVNATVGTQLILNIKDNTGLGKTSAAFPVLTGSGDSCIGAGGGSAPSGSTTAPGGSTPSSGGGASTPGASTPGASTPAASGGSSKASSSASSTGAKTSTTPGAAMAVQAPVGVVAFLAGLFALLA